MLKRYLALGVIYILNCLPIKKNKIFLFSYYGSQYGDSPKYITEYILKSYPKGKFDVVWAFNDLMNKEHLSGFRKVKTMSLKYFYELCTSKVIVTNFRTTDLFVKRKGQYYIQTWHSSLRLKQIEKDAECSLPHQYVEMAKKDSLKCDLLLSGCEYSTKIFKRAFWYEGEIFESGTPANDLLFNPGLDVRKTVLERLKLSTDIKIALYAPTFRKDGDISVYDLNLNQVIESLTQKFGGKWFLLLRLHPHLSLVSKKIKSSKNIINVTQYDDVQELMYASDILITDYSSVMFSFLLTKKPCFLYVPDLKSYIENDRRLYFDIKELPFTSAITNEEIKRNIREFSFEGYEEGVSKMLKIINSFEDGNACEKLLNKIEKEIG
ncbi:CDP-glycerol glycerophosphotransferase family protein [Neobacillus soli]|uniref:CDP-glycerol glycerophosphotransferase family protein n=1 Tax=Neobacillus soli TaxID=220688 RepID=UPI0008259419|nr:CDP-glycerol glycerophosphotransferase family protein [Neobacillus soli]